MGHHAASWRATNGMRGTSCCRFTQATLETLRKRKISRQLTAPWAAHKTVTCPTSTIGNLAPSVPLPIKVGATHSENSLESVWTFRAAAFTREPRFEVIHYPAPLQISIETTESLTFTRRHMERLVYPVQVITTRSRSAATRGTIGKVLRRWRPATFQGELLGKGEGGQAPAVPQQRPL